MHPVQVVSQKWSAEVVFSVMQTVFTDEKKDLISLIEGLKQFPQIATSIRELDQSVGFVSNGTQVAQELDKIHASIIDIFFVKKNVDLSSFPTPTTRDMHDVATHLRQDVQGPRLLRNPVNTLNQAQAIFAQHQATINERIGIRGRVDHFSHFRPARFSKDEVYVFHKPEEMSNEDFVTFKEIHKNITEQIRKVEDLISRIETHGLGINVIG